MFKPFASTSLRILLIATILDGCTALPVSGDSNRNLETSATPGERISVTMRKFVTTKHSGADKPQETVSAPEAEGAEVRQCLVDELQQPLSGDVLTVVGPHKLSANLTASPASPNSSGHATLTVAGIPAPPHGTRYAVVVDAEHHIRDPKLLFLPLVVLLVFDYSVQESLELKASIYDVERDVLAGVVEVSSRGKTGTAFGYFGYAAAGFEGKYIDRVGMCRELASRIRIFLLGNK